MEIKKKFLKYICCPNCKRGLVYKKDLLFCKKCDKAYQVKNGIPILINLDCLSKQHHHQINYFKKYPIMTTAEYELEEWHKSFIQRFKENFKKIKNKLIIDAGIGQGYMTIELAKAGAILLSFDLSFPALVRLKKVIEKKGLEDKVFLVCCLAEKLPFKTNIADYLVSNAVLEHLEKEKEAIKEIGRVAKKKSGLMITVPLDYRWLNPFFVLKCLIQDRIIGHLRRYDEKSLQNRFKWLGYQVKKIYYSGHFCKVILTLLLVQSLKWRSWAKKAEKIDRKQENIKYGASNVCAIFQRE